MIGTRQSWQGTAAAIAAGLSLAAMLVLAAYAPAAYAAGIDRPFFKAQSLVVVIGATEDESSGGVAPVAVDFNL